MSCPSRARVRVAVALAASVVTACGGSAPPAVMPRNETPTGPRELATNCFEIHRAMIDESLASWTGLAAAAQLRWIEGGKVPGLDKGKAWPAVSLSAIRTGSLYARMGLRDGDLVYAIDGH